MNATFIHRPVLRTRLAWVACAAIAAAGMLVAPPLAHAATYTHLDNTTTLSLAGAWSAGGPPGTGDVAAFAGTYTTSTNLSGTWSGALSWGGLLVGNISGAGAGTVYVGGSNAGVGGTSITIGSSGIDMSGANQDLVINSATTTFNVSQTWTVASGRNLRFGTSATGGGNALVTGTDANAVITIAGSGVVDLNEGGASGFTDAAGFTNYQGKWQVNSGATLRGQRNGSTAFGSSTAADAITLNGGTLADGGISSIVGNWTWTTNISLAASTSSVIDVQIATGTNRSLKLMGNFSGSGNLTFKETGATENFNNNDRGFIISGTNNTMSGTITIGGTTENGLAGRVSSVRVGGVYGASDTSLNAGTAGTLGTAVVVNNGVLTLSHSDTWTFGNNVSGTGVLRVGSSGITGANTQIVTLGGSNSYTGGTQVNVGSAIFSSTNARPGTGTVTALAGAVVGLGVGAAAPYYSSANVDSLFGNTLSGFSLNATSGVGIDTSAGDFTYSSNIGSVTRALLKSGSNTLTLSGSNAYTGITTVAGGTLSVSADKNLGAVPASATAGSLTIREGAAFRVTTGFTLSTNRSIALGPTTGTGTGTIVVDASQTLAFGGTIANNGGTGALGKDGAGTLTLSASNAYTGGTTLTAGQLNVNDQNALGTGTFTIAGGTIDNTSGTAVTLATNNVQAWNADLAFAGTNPLDLGTGTVALSADRAVTVTSSTLTVGGNIGGAFALTKKGAGTLVLSASSAYSGGTTLSEGTIRLGNANALGAATGAVAVNSGTLDLNGNSVTVGLMTGSSGATIRSGVAGAVTLTATSASSGTFGGAIVDGSGTLALTKVGSGTLTLSGNNSYSGTTTISGGVLAIAGNLSLGSNLTGASSSSLQFGANTITIGTSVAGDSSSTYNGKLDGTGTLRLRGGSSTIMSVDGTTGTSGNGFSLVPATAQMPPTAFALDTGASTTDRKDFGFRNDSGDVLTLSSLTGYGAIRGDGNGNGTPRFITVNQSNDTTFNGAIVSSVSTGSVSRPITFEKQGAGTLTLAGFIGRQTVGTLSGSGAPVNLIANGGMLLVTNTFNSTTGSTAAINSSGTVTITSGTLGFAPQALINTAGTQGVASIQMNGGVLLWYGTNTQDITTGGGFSLVAGKTATLDTNGNNVTLATGFGGTTSAVVVKNGAGTLTLSASNSWTGGTTLNVGVLSFGTNALGTTGAVTLNGGTLQWATGNVQDLSSRLTLVSGSTATLDTNGNDVTLATGFGGSTSAAVVKNGGGTLTLSASNSWSGGTTLNAGRISFVADALGSGTVTASSGTLQWATGNTQDLSSRLALVSGGTAALDTNGNSVTLASAFGGSTTAALASVGSGTLRLAGANTYTGATTISAGLLSVPSLANGGAASPIGASDSGAGNLVLGNAALVMENGSGASSTDRLFTLAGSGTIINNDSTAADSLTFSNTGAVVQSGAGTRTLTLGGTNTGANTFALALGDNGASAVSLSKANAGTWSITGTASTYTGATTLVGGNVSVQKLANGGLASSLGASTNVATNLTLNGVTLTYLGGGDTTDRAFKLSANSTIKASGSGALTWTGSGVAFGGAANAAYTLTLGGTSTAANAFGTPFTDNGTGANSVTKSEAGTWALSGSNSYSGGTTLNAGQLNINNANAIGTGTFTIGGGTIDNTSGTAVTLATNNVQAWNANFAFAGTNPLNLGTGTVALAANRAVTVTSSMLTVGGNVGGAFTLTKNGAGTLVLTASSAYSGGTTLNAGILSFGTNALGTTGNVTLNGGTLQWASGNAQDLSSRLTLVSGSTATLDTNGNAVTLASAFGGSTTASFVKAGAGTLTLTAANTFTGATTISSGTLKFTGSGAVANSSSISIASGATLDWGRAAAMGVAISGSGTVLRSTSGNAVFSGANSAFQGSWYITTVTGTAFVGLSSDSTVGASDVGMTWDRGGVYFTATGNTLAATRTITLGAGGGWLNGATNNTNTFAATFTGTGALNKVSGETAILTGTSDFTGGINITGGGTLQIGSAGKLGGTSGIYNGNISISSGNTLAFATSADQTLSGTISSAGVINKSGAGTLTLTAANTYTGATTVSGGTLSVGADNNLGAAPGSFTAGNVVVNGATLAATNSFTLSANRGVSIGPTSGSGTGTFDVASGKTLTVGGTIANNGGTGGLTKIGSGTLALSNTSTYTGITAINAGVLQIGAGGAAGAIATSSTVSVGDSGTLAFNRTDAFSFASPISGAGTVLKLGSLETGLTGSNSFSGLIDIQAGKIAFDNANAAAGTPSVNIASGATLSLSNSLNSGTATIANLTGSGVIDPMYGTAGTRTLSINPTTSGTYSGTIRDATSGAARFVAIVKAGANTLTFSGTNTYTGTTTISGGTLRMEGAGVFSGSSALAIANAAGATFDVNGTAQTVGGLSGGGATGGTVQLGAGTLTVSQTSGVGTFAGVVAGTGGLVKSGAGALVLTGSNSFSGGTTLSSGTLQIGNDFALGSGTATLSAGVLSSNGATARSVANSVVFGGDVTLGDATNNGALAFTGPVSLGGGTSTLTVASSATMSGIVSSGGFTKAGAATLTLTGTSTYAGDTTISSGTLAVGGSGQLGGGTYAGAIASAGALVYASSANQTLSGAISGTGALTHSGAGALTLTGSNTYTGATTISSGTFEVGGAGRLGGGAYAGAIANAGALRFTTSANQTLSGGITGNGTLLKSGGGRLTLAGINTFNGATTVDSGTLAVNGQVTASAITVNSGGYLGGSGTTADVTLAAGATVSPGNSPGLLTVANMTWSGSSSYDWQLVNYQAGEGTGWDSIFGSGSLTVNATTASPFTFNLISLSSTNSNTPGPAFNWSQTTSGSFRLASFAGGFSLAEPSGTWWTLNTAGFTPLDPATGAFSLSLTSTDVYLVYTYTPPPLYTWTAGTGVWSGTGNWDSSTAPYGTPELAFAGPGGTSTNDITTGTGATEITVVKGITFTGSATGAYTIDGNAFNLGTLGVTNNSAYQQSMQNGITLAGDATLNAATAGLVFSGTIDTNGGILTVTGSSPTSLSSLVTGSGSLVKLGSGTVTLGGANDFTGGTTINAGTVVVGDGTTSGVLPGNVTNNAAIVFDRSDDVTFGGVIAGTGALTKLNANTLTLTGTSSYSGATTISSGTLALGGAGQLGGGAYAGAISNSGALAVATSADQTLSGSIGGSGSLVKDGTGTLTLTASNSYAGGTTLSAGTLRIGNDSALGTGTATLNAGTLSSNGGTGRSVANALVVGGDVTLGDVTNNGALAFTGPVSLGGGNRTLTVASSATMSGIISSGGLTKAGPATLTLTGVNTYAGDTTISSGTLVLGGAGQLGGGTYAGAITNNGVLSVATSANQTLSGSVGGSGALVKSGAGTLTLSNSPNGYTGGSTITGGTVSFASGALGPSGAVAVNNAALQWATGNTDDLSSRLTLVNSTTATLDTNGNAVTLATGIGGATTAVLTKVGAGTLILSGSNTYTGATVVSGGTLQIGAGGTTGSVAGTITTDAALVFNRSDSTTYSSVISGVGSLTQAGSGTLALSNANTYTGATTITAGVLQIGAGSTTGAISSSSAVSIASGGTLAFNRSNNLTVANAISGAGGLQKFGAGDLDLTGSNSFSGLIDIQAGKIAFNNVNVAAGLPSVNIASGATLSLGTPFAGGTATISGLTGSGTVDPQFAGSNDTRTLNIAQATSGTFSGTLKDASTSSRLLAIVKSGAGALTLTGANSYTAGTTLVSGTLMAANSNALGTTGTVTINTAATGASNTGLLIDASGASITIARPISVANQGSGVTTIGSGTLAASRQAIFSGTIALAKDVTLFGADVGDRTQFSGGIGGTGNVTVTTAGGSGRVLFITTANTFSGSVTISPNSVLQLSDGSASTVSLIPDTADVTIGSGGFLKLAKGGNSESINTLLGAGTVTAIGGADTLVVGASGGSGTFSGVITQGAGTLALTKQGAGTQTLSGVSAYTGATTVNAGTLQLLGSGSLSSSTSLVVSNSTGATFDLNGLSQSVAGLTGGGATGGTVLLGSGTLTVSKSSGTDTFAGVISGGGMLVKSGAGGLALTGSNAYSGGTTLSAGTLQVGNDNAIGTGTAALNGGTLSSNSTTARTLANAVTVGGNVTLGDATNTGTLTFNGPVDLTSGTRTLTAASTVLIAGAVSNGGLTKAGSGALTLSASNSYSGGTTLSAGGLNLGNASALGTGTFTITSGTIDNSSGAALVLATNNPQNWNGSYTFAGTNPLNVGTGAVTLGAGSTVTVTTSTMTVGGAVGGAFALTKAGNGTLVLSASNGYSGGTTLSAGTLQLGNAAALGASTGALAVNGGTLDLAGNSPTVGLLSGASGASITSSVAGPATLTANSASAGTYAGTISDGAGQVALFKAGVGALTLSGSNTYSGVTTIAGGTLVMTGNNATTGNLTVQSGGLLRMENANAGTGFTGGNSSMTGNYTIDSGGEMQAYRQGFTAFGSGTIIMNGGSLFQTGGSWTWTNAITLNAATSSTIGNKTTGSGRFLKLQGIIGGSGNVTFSDPTGAITDSNFGIILSGSNTMSGTVTIDTFVRVGGVPGESTSAVGGVGGTLGTAAVTVNSGKILTFSRSDALTVPNTIGGAGQVYVGSSGITNSNMQVLTLTGSNLYAGGTNLNVGQLNVNNQNAIGTGTFTIVSGTIDNTSGNPIALAANNAQAWNGNFTFVGSNPLDLGTGTVTLGANRTVTVTSSTLTVGGAVGGAFALTKGGTGTLVLSASNGYSGGTTLLDGQLNVNNASALGSGVFTISSSGSVSRSIDNTSGNAITLTTNNGQSWANDFTFVGSNPLNLGTGTVGLASNRQVTVTSSTLTVGGTISGAFSLTKAGAGTLVLSGTSTYSGTTTLAGGSLMVAKLANGGSSSSIGNASAAANLVFNGGALTYTGTGDSTNRAFTIAQAPTINANGSGALTWTATASPTFTSANTAYTVTLGGTSTAANTFGTVLADNGSGAVSLLKSGAGRWALSGANTFTGATTIAGGTLSVAGDGNLGTAPGSPTAAQLVINDGAALSASAGFTLNANRGIAIGPSSGVGAGTINVATGTVAYAGVVADNAGGSGGLVKSGAGSLRFSGVSTFTGSTSITGGTLEIAGSGQLGGGSYAGAIANAGALVFSGSANQTLAGAVSGAGTIGLTGGGRLTMTAVNTLSGSTTVDAGTLVMNGSLVNSPLTMNAGTLMGSGTLGQVTLNSGATIAPGNSPGTLSFSDATWAGGANYNWELLDATGAAGTGWDIFSGTGTLTLNATSGNKFNLNLITLSTATTQGAAQNFVSGSAYSWTIASYGSMVGFDSSKFLINPSSFVGANGTFSLADNGTSLVLSYAPLTAYVYTGSTGDWATTGNWYLDLTPSGTATLEFSGPGGTATNNLASGTLAVVEKLTFTGSAGVYSLDGDALTIGSGGIVNQSANLQTVQNGLTLAADSWLDASSAGLVASGTIDTAGYLLSVQGTANTTVSGRITGSGGLLKLEAGALVLTGSSDYSGGSTLTAGLVRAGNASALGTGTITMNGGALSADGASPTTLANAVSLLDDATFGDATNNGNLTLAGNVDLGGVTRQITTPSNVTLAGTVSSGGLTKTGAGTLTLSASNSYAGGTTLSAGTLIVTNTSGLGTGAATVNGGVLAVTGTGSVGPALVTLTSGTIQVGNDGALGTGTATFNGGTFSSDGATARSLANVLAIGGNVTLGDSTNNGLLTFSGSVGLGGATRQITTASDVVLSGAVGAGGLTKAGAGALTLSASNSYAAGTTLSAGRLNLNNASAIGTGTFTIAGSGTIDNTFGSSITLSTNNAQAWNADFTFAGSNPLNLGTGAVTLGAARAVTVTSSTLTVGGIIGGGFSLTKAGAGTLTLSGANTYSGGTVINAGTVRITAANNLGTSGITINSSGTLNTVPSVTTTTISASVAGSGAWLHEANVLELSGSNSYSGLFTVTGGNLVFTGTNADNGEPSVALNGGGLSAGGNFAGKTLTIGNLTGNSASSSINPKYTSTTGTKTLSVNQTVSGTFAGKIEVGDGNRDMALTKGGAATLTLTNANTYGGPTIVNGGTLTLAPGGTVQSTASFTVNSGATALISSTNFLVAGHGTTVAATRVITVSGGAIVFDSSGESRIGNVTLTNGGTFTSNRGLSSYDILLANVSTGAATVTVSGNAAATMNGSGGIHLQGMQNFDVADVTGDANADLTVSLILGGTGSAGGSAGGVNKTGAGTLVLSASNSYAGGTTLNAGILSFGTNSLGTTGTVTLNGGTLQWASGNSQDLSSRLTLVSGSTATLDTNGNDVTFASGFGGSTTASLVKAGAGTLTFSGTATYTGSTTINSGTLALGGAGLLGGGAYSGAIANAGTFSVATSANQTLSGAISGTGFLDKSGVGALTLSASNSYGGGTRISAGSLLVGNDAALGSGTVTLTGGVLSSNGATARTLANALAFGGDATLGNATNNGLLTFNGGVDLGGQTRQITTPSNVTFGGAVTNGGLTKAGSGALTLSAANSYGGGTLLSAGSLLVGNDAALGSGTVTLAGGVLSSNGATARTLANAVVVNGDTTLGNATNNGLLTFNGGVDLGNAVRQITMPSNVTIAGVVTNGGLTKAGVGTLTLSAANTYSGATTISAGTLALSGGGSIQSSSGVNLSAAGAALDISGASGDRTIGSLAGAAGSQILLGGHGLTAGDATNTAFGGVIGGSGGFTKAGSGILTFSDIQTFTGGARVDAGTLAIGGTNTLAAASQIFVAEGATLDATAAGLNIRSGQLLGGYGLVDGNATSLSFASGATLSPGGSVGSLDGDFSNATLTGGMTYVFEVNMGNGTAGGPNGWDLFTNTGAITLDASGLNQINLTIASLDGLVSGSAAGFDPTYSYAWKFLVAGSGNPITSNPGWFNVNASNFVNDHPGTFYVARGDQISDIGAPAGGTNELFVVYAAVPEPGTLALAGIGLAVAGLAVGRRRRRGNVS